MKKFLLLAFAIALIMPAEAQIIRHDMGGVVRDYAIRVHKAIKSGEAIKIDGVCASACTLYLAKGVNLCITQKATFKFHAPYDSRTGAKASGTAEFMMYNYPKWVQNYINKKGGLSRNWITIPYSYAKKYMRTC